MDNNRTNLIAARFGLRWVRQVNAMHSLRLPLALSLVGTIAAVAIAMSCGWDYSLYHSVRFHYYKDQRKFYRLPPLPDLVDPQTGRWKSLYDNWTEDHEAITTPTPSPDFWQQAPAAKQQGDGLRTQRALKSFLKSAATNDIDYWQEQVNSAQDRLDAMTALRQGATLNAVKNYLALRCEFDSEVIPLPEAEKATDESPSTQAEAALQIQGQALTKRIGSCAI